MAICLPSSGPTAWETFHLDLNVSSNHFSCLGASRTVQVFVLEFSNDGLAYLGDVFAETNAANQAVILQGGVCLNSGQVSQHYCQFQSNF